MGSKIDSAPSSSSHPGEEIEHSVEGEFMKEEDIDEENEEEEYDDEEDEKIEDKEVEEEEEEGHDDEEDEKIEDKEMEEEEEEHDDEEDEKIEDKEMEEEEEEHDDEEDEKIGEKEVKEEDEEKDNEDKEEEGEETDNDENNNNNKKRKRKTNTRPAFQRIWKEEDEILLLKYVFEFYIEKGIEPLSNLEEFTDLVKKSIKFNLKKTQVCDKVRRLKKKYENDVKRFKNSKVPTFSNLHNERLYMLSKRIWGEKEDDMQDLVKMDEKVEDLKYPHLNKSLQFINGNLTRDIKLKELVTLISDEKAEILENQWQLLQVAEMKIAIKRTELIHMQTNLLLNALKQ